MYPNQKSKNLVFTRVSKKKLKKSSLKIQKVTLMILYKYEK